MKNTADPDQLSSSELNLHCVFKIRLERYTILKKKVYYALVDVTRIEEESVIFMLFDLFRG